MQQKYPDAAAMTVAANAIAVAISKGLTLEQQNILGNLMALVGASMLSMAAINQANSSGSDDSSGDKKSTSGAAAPDVLNS